MAADLEALLDELYGAGLDEFVRRRDAAAKELRAAGERDAAAAVKALRKPTVSAWAVNRLARRHRREIDLLLDAGHRLREAQREALAGEGREAFAEARSRHADVVADLARRAQELLAEERGRPSEAVADRIGETLRATSISDEGRELLARGRLTADVEPGGFDALAELAAAVAPAPKPGPETQARRREEIRAREAALREARVEARRRTEEARDAAKAARRVRAELVRLEQAADEARARAEAAAEAVERARSALADAKARPGD